MLNESCRIGFVMEHALGHVTHAQYLRRWVERDAGVAANWMMIPYQADDLWERIPGLPFSLKLSLRARSLLRRTLEPARTDCLFMHTQGLCLFSLDYMKSVPTVISLDATPSNFKSIAPAYDSAPSAGLADQVKSRWFGTAFSRAAALVGFSRWVRESLIRDYDVAPEKAHVNPPGIDLQQWQAGPGNRGASTRRLRLLFVGSDFQRKGGDVLLTAFRGALSDFCELDIVSKSGPNRPGDFVRLHSDLSPGDPRLKQLYAEADVFVLPTHGDATPFAILEAMASSLPVVTTRVGALDELVEDGVTGHLIPPGDPKALVDTLTALAADRGRVSALGRAGRAVVEERFDAQTNYRRLIGLLKEIGSRGNGGTLH